MLLDNVCYVINRNWCPDLNYKGISAFSVNLNQEKNHNNRHIQENCRRQFSHSNELVNVDELGWCWNFIYLL